MEKKTCDFLTDTAEFALNELRRLGAEKARVGIAKSEKTEFNADGGKFTLMRTTYSSSVSLMAIKDGKKGTASVNKTDRDSVANAAAECIEVSESSDPDPCWDIAPDEGRRSFTYGCGKADTEKLFSRSGELLDGIREKFPKIIVEQMIVSHTRVCSVYENSNGSVFDTEGGSYFIELMYSAHEGEKSTSFFSDGVMTDNLDVPFMKLASIEKNLADVEKQLDTVSPDGKFVGDMLIPPACLGDFLSSVFSNFISDGAILGGSSIWKDKTGETVADGRVTVKVSKTDKRIVAPDEYTPEGFICEDYDIIKNGVLENFMISQYVANKSGKKRAASSDSAIVMEGGDKKVSELIKGIKRGIVIGRFSGGAPSVNGDFTGVAKNSFLIENGKVTSALSETMLSGNLADMLKNVIGISREQVSDGMCVLPYVAVSGITISGK